MSSVNWNEVKTEYITTEHSSYRKLSKKYNIPLGTLYNRAKNEGWVEAKKQFTDKTMAKTLSAIESQQVNKLKRIQDISDKLLDKIEKAIDELDIQLFKDVEKTKVIEYNNEERPDKPTKETIHEEEKVIEIHTIIDRKGVQELSAAIKNLKEVQMLKSDLDIAEQEARINKLRKDAEDEQTDTSVEVVMSEEAEDYAN